MFFKNLQSFYTSDYFKCRLVIIKKLKYIFPISLYVCQLVKYEHSRNIKETRSQVFIETTYVEKNEECLRYS